MSMSLSDDTDALSEAKVEKDDPLQTTDQVAGSSSTPTSSPPLLKEESSQKANPRPSHEQSLEEMSSDPEKAVDSSATVMGDSDGIASQGKPSVEDANSSQTEAPFSTAQSTLPPPASTVGSMLPPTQKPIRSGNESQKARSQAGQSENVSQNAKEKPNSGKRDHDATSNDNDCQESSVSDEPSDEITDFDWMELEERYHAKMNQLAHEQREIMDEFGGLCNVQAPLTLFSEDLLTLCHSILRSGLRLDPIVKLIVATNGRSVRLCWLSFLLTRTRRLKTQMTLLNHHETELEEKRLHCKHCLVNYWDSLLIKLSRHQSRRCFQKCAPTPGDLICSQ